MVNASATLPNMDDGIQTTGRRLAEQRRAGVPFDAAWKTALDELAATVEHPYTVMGTELEALRATEETWRATYDRDPAPTPRWCALGEPDEEDPGGEFPGALLGTLLG